MDFAPSIGRFQLQENGEMAVRLMDRKLTSGRNLELLADIFRTCGCRKLVLDLADVSVLSGTAIGKLLQLKRNIDNLGGELVLCDLPAPVRKTFAITKIDVLFTIQRSEAGTEPNMKIV